MTKTNRVTPASESTDNFMLHKNLPLADYTTWHVGGAADLVYQPNSLEELQQFLAKFATTNSDTPIYWLGLGSNVLIKDSGIRGLVVLTNSGSNIGLNNFEIQTTSSHGKIITCEAGVPCAKLAKFLAKNNYPGGAFLAGIPGTMGGALAMNAGCYGSETWDHVIKVDVIDRQGNITQLKPSDFVIGYRTVKAKNPPFNAQEFWFVRAYLQFTQDDSISGVEAIKSLLQKRTSQQPIGLFSGGSVFRNPPGNFAGKLIEAAGLKGYTIGGAEISPKHANFIINNKTATAKDIEDLITHAQNIVFANTGIKLETEIRIIGEEK